MSGHESSDPPGEMLRERHPARETPRAEITAAALEARHSGSVVRPQVQASVPALRLGRAICGDPDLALEREWLVTNGIGGFASGTIGLANARRYHGLLVAALSPPVGRILLVAGLDALARYGGREFGLNTNEYQGGVLSPDGYRYIEAFTLDGGIPTWEFAIADARLTRSVWMGRGANTSYIRYTLDYATAPMELELAPLCTWRDYHGHARGSWTIGSRMIADGVEIVAFDGARPYRVTCAGAGFRPQPDWYWNFRHRIEAERGLDDAEDLFCPGRFAARLEPGQSLTVVCTAEDEAAPADAALAAVRERASALVSRLPEPTPPWIRLLALAADQFIVARGAAGATVIAGYPWFTDWGRDTMIALPGLTIAAGRPEIAAEIIRTFSRHVSQGMLPNRFPDGGEIPEYNTADATLWYFQAVAAYVGATGDLALAREIFPLLADIVTWHQRGTRYGIRVDAADGLLLAGEPGVQLTWMDAKIGDWVVTPRIGKPVEINALWVNALAVMADLARRLNDARAAQFYGALATQTTAAFRERFWFERGGYLYDVVDGPDGELTAKGGRADASLRPNQIFAVSLPASLLAAPQARSVVDVCARELLTSGGLRSLSERDSRFVARYQGGPVDRDSAYHQGTVWSWLLGPFALAHYRVYGDAARAIAWLAPLADHLTEGCVGSVSEIFDGEAPFRPRGCFAQAWSVAETLRAWREIGNTEQTPSGEAR